MIPNTSAEALHFQPLEMASRTFHYDLDRQRIRGFTDKLEAMKQAIYLIIHTERYVHPIYSRNYGTELADLIGQPISYVLPEIKRRVTDALLQDDRITGTDNWQFNIKRGIVTATFTVHTIWGDVESEVSL